MWSNGYTAVREPACVHTNGVFYLSCAHLVAPCRALAILTPWSATSFKGCPCGEENATQQVAKWIRTTRILVQMCTYSVTDSHFSLPELSGATEHVFKSIGNDT